MKPIKSASERDRERTQATEAARVAALMDDLSSQLEVAGWTNIRVQKRGPFIAVSALDPTGTSHSGAMEDGQALTDFLIRIGVAPPPRTRGVAPANPERLAPIRTPSAELVMTAADRAALEAERDEAREAIAIALKDIERLKQEKSELESRPPEVREVRVEVPVQAPVVVEEATEPYTPDFTLIPDALAKFAEADETATDFRNRLKRLWQRFGIADGEHFPGGGEPLTGEEKITMREIDIVLNSDEGRNAGLLQWLQADEQNT